MNLQYLDLVVNGEKKKEINKNEGLIRYKDDKQRE